MSKRRHVDDVSCVFCSEPESIQHLFFECIVARQLWVAESVDIPAPSSFCSLLSFWKAKKRFDVVNLITSAAYGFCAMNLSSRGEDGEAFDASWTWWAQKFDSEKSFAQTIKLRSSFDV